MNLNFPIRMGIQGCGQVISKHVYPAVKQLEKEGIIKLTSIIEKGNLEDRIGDLEMRAEKYSLEKESCEDMANRLKDGSLNYIKCNGEGLPCNLKEQIDFEYLATPTNVRYDPIKQLVEMGIPFIVEKPLAKTIEEARRILKIAEEGGTCSDHYSWKDPTLELINNFEKKASEFGRIKSIEAVLEEKDYLEAERNRWLLDPAINGGGIWIDTGVHLTHPILIIGGKLENVLSSKSYKYEFPTGDKRNEYVKSETAAEVYFKLAGEDKLIAPEATARIRVGKCMPESKKYFNIDFEKGNILLDFDENSIRYTNRTNSHPVLQKIVLPKTNPYYNLIKSFVTDNLCNKKSLSTSLPRIEESTEAVFRAYDVMEEGNSKEYYKVA